VSIVDVFDLNTEKFIPPTISLPMGLRRALSACSMNGTIIFAGGLSPSADNYSDVFLFNPQSADHTWQLLPQLPLNFFSPGSGVCVNFDNNMLSKCIA
jgi:hypothetical protein